MTAAIQRVIAELSQPAGLALMLAAAMPVQAQTLSEPQLSAPETEQSEGKPTKDVKRVKDSDSTAAGNRLGFDKVVVTGTGVARRKFDTSYAISNMSAEDIQKMALLNTADLIGLMPGVQAEATGGEAQNVYRRAGHTQRR